MEPSITLTVDVPADPARVFEVLSTTAGQRSFWTANCDVEDGKARFGFAAAPIDLQCSVTTEPDRSVRMHVDSGFPFWEGSTWEWTIGTETREGSGSSVLFTHTGFGEGYPPVELGYTAQTWAHVQDRLAAYLTSGTPQPFFPET